MPCSASFWWQDYGWMIIRVIVDSAAIGLVFWIAAIIKKSP